MTITETTSKAISTVDLAKQLLGIFKTASIVLVMALLEWSRIKENRAKLDKKLAEDNLEIEKLKNKDDDRTDEEVVRDFLDSRKPGAK